MSFKSNKSPGADDISPKILREISIDISRLLAHIFILSFYIWNYSRFFNPLMPNFCFLMKTTYMTKTHAITIEIALVFLILL